MRLDLLPHFVISLKNFYNVPDRDRVDECIENNHWRNKNEYKSYNFPITEDSTSFFSKLYDKYLNVCYEYFGDFHVSDSNSRICWCYRSKKKNWYSVWHSHFDTSTINGVYYYQVDGDGITFGPGDEYTPEQGELIIFPGYMGHKPLPTTSTQYRYSINMEILTKESAREVFKDY